MSFSTISSSDLYEGIKREREYQRLNTIPNPDVEEVLRKLPTSRALESYRERIKPLLDQLRDFSPKELPFEVFQKLIFFGIVDNFRGSDLSKVINEACDTLTSWRNARDIWVVQQALSEQAGIARASNMPDFATLIAHAENFGSWITANKSLLDKVTALDLTEKRICSISPHIHSLSSLQTITLNEPLPIPLSSRITLVVIPKKEKLSLLQVVSRTAYAFCCGCWRP